MFFPNLSNTLATLIGHKIEIYSTTGAVGAARAAGLLDGDFDKFGKNITNNDHVMTYLPLENKTPYLDAYLTWKNELEILLKSKLLCCHFSKSPFHKQKKKQSLRGLLYINVL